MKLYVPKNQAMPLDVKEDEHVMDLADYLTLKEIMEQFKSFDQLPWRFGISGSIRWITISSDYPVHVCQSAIFLSGFSKNLCPDLKPELGRRIKYQP